MDTSSVEHRRNIFKLSATDECYVSARLLLDQVREQAEEIKVLKIKIAALEVDSALRIPLMKSK